MGELTKGFKVSVTELKEKIKLPEKITREEKLILKIELGLQLLKYWPLKWFYSYERS